MKKWIVLVALGCSSALFSPPVQARGVAVAVSQLTPRARQTLRAGVQRAKGARPGAFRGLAKLRGKLVQLDAKRRGRLAAMTPSLRALGSSGLWPMLNELALQAPVRGKLSKTAWRAWRVGLLEAVGALRDGRSQAVLEAVLVTEKSDGLVLRAAAGALGKLGTDAVASKLIALSRETGMRGRAVLASMGYCRRRPIALRLAEAMRASRGQSEVRQLARSLGDVGSAWAWATPVVAAAGDGGETRRVALQALVDAFVKHASHGERRRLTQAILVVDHASTPALIDKAKATADAATREALEQLRRRFERSPLRR